MRPIRREIGLQLALLVPVLSSCGTPVDVGQLSGIIRFEPASPAVLNYLNGNPAQPGGTVVATNTAATSQSATGTYTVPGGTAPPALAAYSLNPNVDATGSTFAMRVNDVRLQNNAHYRFGTVQATSPGALISAAVLPSGVQTFDISECPALARVTARLTGPAVDIDALDETATCTAVAGVRENPAGAQIQPQASSAPVVTSRTALRNEGVPISMLLRSGQMAQITTACIFTTSQPGFPQSPLLPEGTVVFNGSASELIDVPCQGEPVVELDIPVVRSAQIVRGLLDVVGNTESQIRIDLSVPGFQLTQDVTGAPPPHQWQFDAVPTGQHTVTARALLDDGNAVLRFPRLEGIEGAQVTAGQTTDLGPRFVAIPFMVQSSLSLRDPRAGTRLPSLVLNPFASVTVPPSNSFLKADGQPFVAEVDGQLGANGTSAASFAKLNGGFDSAAQRWDLTASLPLVGLSPLGGSTNGANTLPAPWRVTGFGLQFSQADVFQESLNVTFNTQNQFNSTPNGQATLTPVDVCFGEFAPTFQAPANFTLFAPRLEIVPPSIPQQSVDDNGASLRYNGANGMATTAPLTEANAASSVTAAMVLPAFLRHRLRPEVKLRNQTTAQVTTLTLAELDAVPNGMIGCGSFDSPCVQVDESGGTVATVRTQIFAPAATCDPGNLQVTIVAESTGAALQSVVMTIDNQSPVEVCGAGTCGNVFQQPVSLGANTPGPHSVVVTASTSTCTASAQQRIVVAERPQLLCPPAVVVQRLPSEAQVPFERISSRLQASWSGICPGSALPPILDDHPASFPLGSTVVRFSSGSNGTPVGEQECETPVTVLPADACTSFETMTLGQLTGPTIIGEAVYRPLQGAIARITDQFPANQPDGQRELEIGAVEVELPFAARTVQLQYVKAHSKPIKIDGFDDTGQLVQTWESPESEEERLRFTRLIPGPARRRLRVSAQGGEDLLLRLCYSLNPPPAPQPGDVILVPPP
ncbi:MAG TPA: hypothetical protein VIB38_05190 [Aestuariivirgaceae bacterium]|jgi:hypothetical protein